MEKDKKEFKEAAEKASTANNGYNAEIRLLKKTVKALAKMVLHYRMGKTQLPEWVFENLNKAQNKYGEDLTKIK